MKSNWSYSPETPNSGWNQWLFVPYDLEIWRMTLKNNRAPFLCYFKLCGSFHSHQWNQTGVTVRKRPVRVKIDDFLSRVTLKFGRWPWKTIDLEIWQMTLKNNRTPLPCYTKLCASFRSHRWIQTWVTVRKCPIWVKIGIFLAVWPWNLMYDLEKQ